MKTSLLVLASLALGTAAVAQDAPQTTPPAATTPTPDAAAPAAPAAMPAPADAAAPTTAATPTPDASATPAPAATDTSSYPTCSRTVTDKCVQRGAVHRTHHK